MAKPPPRKAALKVWPAEVIAKCERIKALGPMKEPFRLAPWAFVVDPLKFHESILMDIKAGPTGPRGRLGATLGDLDLYLTCHDKGRA